MKLNASASSKFVVDYLKIVSPSEAACITAPFLILRYHFRIPKCRTGTERKRTTVFAFLRSWVLFAASDDFNALCHLVTRGMWSPPNLRNQKCAQHINTLGFPKAFPVSSLPVARVHKFDVTRSADLPVRRKAISVSGWPGHERSNNHEWEIH